METSPDAAESNTAVAVHLRGMDALTLAQQIVAVIRQSGLDYPRRYSALDIARHLVEDSNYEPATRDAPSGIDRSKSA